MSTRTRKKSRKSRKSCKYGKLKRSVRTKSGSKRRCKKKPSKRKKSKKRKGRGKSKKRSGKRRKSKKRRSKKRRKYKVDDYMSDGSVDGYFDSDEEWENRDWETLEPLVTGSRCKRNCVGDIDMITLEPIRLEDNAVRLDRKCYSENSIRQALRIDPRVPHSRKRFTEYNLNRILNRSNDNECL